MPAPAVPAFDELIDRVGREDAGLDPVIGGALQDAINAVDTAEGARGCILRVAERAHARLPQYAGYWLGEEWQIGVIDSCVDSGMGVALEAGDVILWHVPTAEEVRSAETDGLAPCATAYSVRNSVGTAIFEDVDVRQYPAGVLAMSPREPEITSHRRGATIGVNRDGRLVGIVADIGNRRFAMRLYTTECPWEQYAGVAASEAKAVRTVGLRGETPGPPT